MTAAISYVDAAVLYASGLGWPVFPAHPQSKCPLIKTGRGHAERASRDPDQIRRWFERDYRNAAIAMPTGAVSGVVVIDADRKHNGEALLLELELKLGPLVRTLVARTQSGGLHVYLKHPGVRIKSTAGKLGRIIRPGSPEVPGVDVRGDGGIVLLPPSAGYRWETVGEPSVMGDAWIRATRADVERPRCRPVVSLIGQATKEVKLGEIRRVLSDRVRSYRAAARRARGDRAILESLATGGGMHHRDREDRATRNGDLLERLLRGEALAEVGGRDDAVTHSGFLVGLHLPAIGPEAATLAAWKALEATPATGREDLAHWIEKFKRGYERGAEVSLDEAEGVGRD